MLIFWKYLKRFLFAVLAIVLTTLGIHLCTHLQPAVNLHELDGEVTAPPPHLNSFSIGIYNIAHGRGDGSELINDTDEPKDQRDQRLKDINTHLAKAPPTFLILNECDFDTYWSHYTFQPALIGKGHYRYAITQSNYRARLWFRSWNFGNAILTNLKPTKTEFIQFTPLKKTETLVGNHDALLAHFTDAQGQKIRLLAVHLEVRSEATRILAAEKILEIQQREDSPLFVAGDFNSQLLSDQETAINLLLDTSNNAFQSAIPTDKLHPTFPSKKPNHRLDWILAPTSYTTRKFKIDNLPLSDHGYVEATFISK